MYKTTARKRTNHVAHDVYGDLAKIKDVLYDVTSGMKDKAGAALSQSFEDVRDRSVALKDEFGTVVSNKPIRSVGAALVTGLLIGYFIHK